MNADYPTRYRDRHGEVATVIHNDGKCLSMTVRGVEFGANDLDDFEPLGAVEAAAATPFPLHNGSLCSCDIEFEMPLAAVVRGEAAEGVLSVRLELGDPRPPPTGGLDWTVLTLALSIDGQVYRSAGTSGWFEDELLDLHRQLPEGVAMKACITCAFSDYSPYGHGLFGDLACFRDNKAGYLACRGKPGIFRHLGHDDGVRAGDVPVPRVPPAGAGDGVSGLIVSKALRCDDLANPQVDPVAHVPDSWLMLPTFTPPRRPGTPKPSPGCSRPIGG